MANRKNTFLLKRSNVAGNIPVAGQIELGELALNTADVKLYASGTTTNSILQVGWDRVSRTGDTMTGTLYLPTISATTYQNLPSISGLYLPLSGGTVTGQTIFSSSLSASTISAVTYNGYLPATQDGTILYSPTKSFTPTGTVSTSNMTVTSIGTQFNNTMIGAKLIISGDSRIITGYTSTTVVTVDRPYTQNYSAVAAGNWGVYFKVFEIPASGYPNFYLGNQSGGAPPGTVFLSNNAGFVNTQFAFTQGTNSFYGDTTNYRASGYIVWAPGTSFDKFGTTNDLGIRRNSAGVLEVFDGWTFSGLTSRRDLLVRNLSASTISATTYENLPTDVFVTGGTYSSGVATFTNTTGGTFNVNGFFTGGTPSVSFTQSSPSTGWTFTHNLGLERPMITVYNSSNQVIIPQEITALSTSTIHISFPVPISGYAIAGGGVIPQQTEEINIITSIIFG
jgi:hypothetical protein